MKKAITISSACKYLAVSPSGYYAWRKRRVDTAQKYKDLKVLLISVRIRAIQKKRLSWQEKIYNWISFNPLICPNCNIPLIISEIKWNKKIYRYNL